MGELIVASMNGLCMIPSMAKLWSPTTYEDDSPINGRTYGIYGS